MPKRTLRKAALVAVLLLALGSPLLASGQLASQDRERGLPAGLDLPVEAAAVAEEPSAISVNPAGLGFLSGPALQYFHETASGLRTDADGMYLADRLGKLALGYSSEWLRPTPLLSRYRRSQFALALTDGHAVSRRGRPTHAADSSPPLARERAPALTPDSPSGPCATSSLAPTALATERTSAEGGRPSGSTSQPPQGSSRTGSPSRPTSWPTMRDGPSAPNGPGSPSSRSSSRGSPPGRPSI